MNFSLQEIIAAGCVVFVVGVYASDWRDSVTVKAEPERASRVLDDWLTGHLEKQKVGQAVLGPKPHPAAFVTGEKKTVDGKEVFVNLKWKVPN